MIHLYRLSMVLALIILVILGLNASNQGIYSLTTQEWGPVFSLDVDDNTITVVTMGTSYDYNTGEMKERIDTGWEKFIQIVQRIYDYLLWIWQIFKVIFLS